MLSAKNSFPQPEDQLVFQRSDGAKQQWQDFRGKTLLVAFWSPTCVLCMKDVPLFNRLHQELQPEMPFQVLGLSMYYDRPDWVIETSEKFNMQYPVYFDTQKKLSKAFGEVVATPTSFLVNEKGEITYRHLGVMDFEQMKQKILALQQSDKNSG